jgi:hypothetical protein
MSRGFRSSYATHSKPGRAHRFHKPLLDRTPGAPRERSSTPGWPAAPPAWAAGCGTHAAPRRGGGRARRRGPPGAVLGPSWGSPRLAEHRYQSTPRIICRQHHELLRVPAPVHVLRRREEPPADQAKVLQAEAVDRGLTPAAETPAHGSRRSRFVEPDGWDHGTYSDAKVATLRGGHQRTPQRLLVRYDKCVPPQPQPGAPRQAEVDPPRDADRALSMAVPIQPDPQAAGAAT